MVCIKIAKIQTMLLKLSLVAYYIRQIKDFGCACVSVSMHMIAYMFVGVHVINK